MEQQKFRLNRVQAAVMVAMAFPFAIDLAYAGAGWADRAALPGTVPAKEQTFYANSPSGMRTDPLTGAPSAIDTGVAMRKFVDTLPPMGCVANAAGVVGNDLGQCIPVASAQKWVDGSGKVTNDDYYEIGVVEYAEQMHSDLVEYDPVTGAVLVDPVTGKPVPHKTKVRGYVQLVPSTWVNPVTGAPAVPLTTANGLTQNIVDAAGNQLYGADKPHYMGPIIIANKGVAVRIKYSNLLPTGAAGDLFIPVDETLTGGGFGPDGVTKYTQNRADIHLHGGDTPWISDGTPLQWVAPAGEGTAAQWLTPVGRGANGVLGPYLKGASSQNVPDMPDPGPGSVTLYFPNNQSARMMFYHDHAVAITRLNVYAGMAAGYLLQDPVELAMMNGGTVPIPGSTASATFAPGTIPVDEIPLVIQDKTFVPKDVILKDPTTGTVTGGQDAKWDPTHWGKPGDLWFPHVYETNQDPTSVDGTNPPGRWDYGPWFWPVFPAPLALPTGVYGDVTTTPEGFMDTPIVNGTAYPSLTVDPKAYRFRILNAANDRMFNLGLYVAEPLTIGVTAPGSGYTAPVVTIAPAVGDTTGAGATATAVTAFSGIQVTAGGSGYVNPTVTISAPAAGGVQATATATVTGGVITAITLTNPGAGYATAPTITIADGVGNPGTGASAVATFGIAGITVTNPGTGYTLPPVVSITDATGTGAAAIAAINSEVKMVPFDSTGVFPTTGGLMGTGWGTPDGRAGGVPDPATVGPDIIQIGTEGGFLPNAAVIPSTPINYEYNKRSVTILNVLEHGLFLGPAERADVVVDFSQFAGKTLILYNDSPAPVPAADPRIDYYTGDPDESAVGGAESTKPGFGPNTRTVMQIKVTGTPGVNGAAFNVAGLQAALPQAYAASQDAPIVGESAYNTAFGTSYVDKYANIYTGSATQPNFSWTESGVAQSLQSVAVTGAGVGYTSPPVVTISGGGGPTLSTADGVTATVSGGKVTAVVLSAALTTRLATPVASGGLAGAWTSGPTVALSGGGGLGATASAVTDHSFSLPVQNKAIQELFDPNYGRMNATLGVELPYTSPLNQTTIPLGYVDPPTENIAENQTQIWKITHNGVDTHPVHFHLFNVQLINRVGWDGTVKPPADNEVGWKETIRMNPLEDVIVAVRPKAPQLPFGVVESNRLMDPSQPAGVATGFTQVDPTTGMPATVTNQMTNFGWEYVWHCHILGHEENDFMRPIVFSYTAMAPASPVPLSAVQGTGSVTLSWTDPTPAIDPVTGAVVTSTIGNKQNEIGYRILRAPGTTTTFTQIGTAPANATTFTDTTATGTSYTYNVVAYNAAGSSLPASVTVGAPQATGVPTAPTVPTATVNSPTQVTLSWGDRSNNETGFIVQRAVVTGGVIGAYSTIGTVPSTASGTTSTTRTVSFVDSAATPGTSYSYQVMATNAAGNSIPSVSPTVTTPAAAALTPPTNLSVQLVTASTAQLTFTDLAEGETGYRVQVSTDGVTWTNLMTRAVTTAVSAGTGSVVVLTTPSTTFTVGNTYDFRVAPVQTVSGGGTTTGAFSNLAAMDMTGATRVAPPTNVTASPGAAGQAVLAWIDNANNNPGYQIQMRSSTNGGTTWSGWSNATNITPTQNGISTGATVGGLVTGRSYQFHVRANAKAGMTASTYTASGTVVAP